MNLGSLPKCDDAEIQRFLERIAGAVSAGREQLVGGGACSRRRRRGPLPHNRRLLCKDGRTHMNWEGLDPDFVVRPWGGADFELRVLGVKREGVERAALVNYAMHPAILAGDNGSIRRTFQVIWRLPCASFSARIFVAATSMVCCGNVNHVDYGDRTMGRGYTMTQRVGYIWPADAYQALRSARPIEGDELPSRASMCRSNASRSATKNTAWCRTSSVSGRRPCAGTGGRSARRVLAVTRLGMYEKQHEDDLPEVMVIRIGDAAVVGCRERSSTSTAWRSSANRRRATHSW
jgi:hypothetical protein